MSRLSITFLGLALATATALAGVQAQIVPGQGSPAAAGTLPATQVLPPEALHSGH